MGYYKLIKEEKDHIKTDKKIVKYLSFIASFALGISLGACFGTLEVGTMIFLASSVVSYTVFKACFNYDIKYHEKKIDEYHKIMEDEMEDEIIENVDEYDIYKDEDIFIYDIDTLESDKVLTRARGKNG